MSGGVSIRPSEKSLIVYNFAPRSPRRTPDIPRRTKPETRRSPLRARTMAERNRNGIKEKTRVPRGSLLLTRSLLAILARLVPAGRLRTRLALAGRLLRTAAAFGRVCFAVCFGSAVFHSTTPFGGLPRMGFRPSGDSIAPLGSFIHRQTSTTPSEHSTAVNGQLSFQSEPLSTAFHSAIVPSNVTEVRESQDWKA